MTQRPPWYEKDTVLAGNVFIGSLMSTLTWPVRGSFVDYVNAAEGSVVASGGVTRHSQGFSFPGAGAFPGIWKFSGTANFEAHSGLLSVSLSDPEVELDPALQGSLSVSQNGTSRVIARLVDVEKTAHTIVATPVLTGEGAYLFGNVYKIGEPFDQLSISL